MTEEQKQKLYKLLDSLRIEQVYKFSNEQGYDLDIVLSVIVQYTNEVHLNTKLGL